MFKDLPFKGLGSGVRSLRIYGLRALGLGWFKVTFDSFQKT